MTKEKHFDIQLKYLAQMLLDDYSNWLSNKGYIDSDYYTEEPRAVEQFMKEYFNN